MLARFSKCDFWIPGQILDLKNFVSKKKRFFFEIEKNVFFFETKFLKSKICPGIQKSHLENRASILKSIKIKISIFLHRFPDIMV